MNYMLFGVGVLCVIAFLGFLAGAQGKQRGWSRGQIVQVVATIVGAVVLIVGGMAVLSDLYRNHNVTSTIVVIALAGLAVVTAALARTLVRTLEATGSRQDEEER